MDIERLISEVLAATAIWDAREAKHSDRLYISKQWDNIAAKLGVTVEAAKRKFKILKDQFRVELKKVPFGKSGDPGLPIEEYLSTWPYFQRMFFLRDSMHGRKTIGNLTSAAAKIRSQVLGHEHSENVNGKELSADMLDLAYGENISITSPLHVIDHPQAFTNESGISRSDIVQTSNESCHSRSRSHTPTGPPTKKGKTLSAQQELVNIEKEKIEWFKKVSENDDDADKHFLLSLLPQMKSLAPNKLSAVKMKFMAILHEASYGEEAQ